MNTNDLIHWPVPTEFPLLRPGEIHLWCASLDAEDGAPPETDCLSPDELARANSFHFPTDRHRYLAARRNLRHLLAHYVGHGPAELSFHYGPCGKPSLRQESFAPDPQYPAAGNLDFNQAHCGALWLVAVAREQRVGVDIEQVRNLPDFHLIESQLFSTAEMFRQRALPPPERRLAFFRRWTEREAAAKYHGASFDPARPCIPPRRSEPLSPTSDSVGTLAHGNAIVRLQKFQWTAELLVRRSAVAA